MRILIATTQIPFVKGGAEMHADQLMKACLRAGHQAEIISIPFKDNPPECILDGMLACRLLDVSEFCGLPIDCLIGLKFPSYLIPHTNKVVWFLHQYRQAYDLWGDMAYGDLDKVASGFEIQKAIMMSDKKLVNESKKIFANSKNVASRLKNYCDIDSKCLYHPPPFSDKLYNNDKQEYFYYPSRITTIKRHRLIIEALVHCRNKVKIFFSGNIDSPEYVQQLKLFSSEIGVSDQINWCGYVTEENKRELYANALAIINIPQDEDLGYVTLEAMLSSKPVITCLDSGGPLEFIKHNETGFVVEPKAEALANTLDELWSSRKHAKNVGQAAYQYYKTLNISWENVVNNLLS